MTPALTKMVAGFSYHSDISLAAALSGLCQKHTLEPIFPIVSEFSTVLDISRSKRGLATPVGA